MTYPTPALDERYAPNYSRNEATSTRPVGAALRIEHRRNGAVLKVYWLKSTETGTVQNIEVQTGDVIAYGFGDNSGFLPGGHRSRKMADAQLGDQTRTVFYYSQTEG